MLLRVAARDRAAATDPFPAPVVSTYRKNVAGTTVTWPRVNGTGPDPLVVSGTMFDATPLRQVSAEILSLSVEFTDLDDYTQGWDELSFSRGDPRWIGIVLAERPSNRADQLRNLIGLRFGADVSAADLLSAVAEESPRSMRGRRDTPGS